MSWLRCDDCDDYFDAKDGNEWRDLGGSITCWNCLQDEEALTMAENEEWDRHRMKGTLAIMEVASKLKGEE